MKNLKNLKNLISEIKKEILSPVFYKNNDLLHIFATEMLVIISGKETNEIISKEKLEEGKFFIYENKKYSEIVPYEGVKEKRLNAVKEIENNFNTKKEKIFNINEFPSIELLLVKLTKRNFIIRSNLLKFIIDLYYKNYNLEFYIVNNLLCVTISKNVRIFIKLLKVENDCKISNPEDLL